MSTAADQAELHEKIYKTKQQLANVEGSINSNISEKRRAELTKAEVESLEEDARTFVGIGRMYLLTPVPEVKTQLDAKIARADEDVATLSKLKEQYEIRLKSAETDFRQMVKSRS